MASINFEFLREEDDEDKKDGESDKSKNQGGGFLDGLDNDFLGGEPELDLQEEAVLTPTQRLDRYINSENVFERQMVARTLLEGLRESLHDPIQTIGMLDHMTRLSNDIEPMVRAELMEQIPHIAMLCHINSSAVPRVIGERILPILVHYLRDNNNQVRKTSQAALLVLLEQGLLESVDVNQQVCPVLEELTALESVDDFRTEAVALMTRMASFLGPDITESFFLPRFTNLCSDTLFHVRKVCAANIGDMCNVVGRGATEQHLLPKFFYLCEDSVWGVRKACAECYMSVSSACSQGRRQSQLAPTFVNLLCDQSRWVRMAAFQQLGPFISTFADDDEKISENEDSSLLQDQVQGEDRPRETPDTNKPEAAKDASPSQEQATPRLAGNEDQLAKLEKLAAGMIYMEEEDEEEEEGEPRIPNTIIVTNSSLKKTEEAPDALSITLLASVLLTEATHVSAADTASSQSTSEQKNTSVPMDLVSSDVTEEPNPKLQSFDEQSPEERRVQKQRTSPTKDVKPSTSVMYSNGSDYNHFNYWYIPPPSIEDPTLPQLTENLSHELESLVIETPNSKAPNVAARNAVELEIDNSFKSPPLAMSSPERVEESPPVTTDGDSSAKGTVIKEEVDADDAVTKLFDDDDGEIPPLLVSDLDDERLRSRLGGSVGSYLDTPRSRHGESRADILETSKNDKFPDRTKSFEESHAQQGSHGIPFGAQNVIPSDLLDYFLSMADPARVQTVDTELTRHCAYSLPAVALTLGRKNWSCLKEIYETLASDMQWKVRYTLACSFHEMAKIMGQEITARDLLPIFDGFLKDLDEVRIGILKHLADFLELLLPKERRMYLFRIRDFMMCDNQRNWRFRLELANQLSPLASLFQPQDVADHILPIAFDLAYDRVAKVRYSSFRAMCACAKTFEFGIPSPITSSSSNTTPSPSRLVPIPGNESLVKSFLSSLVTRFATSAKWLDRQAFTVISGLLLAQEAITQQHFDEYLLLPLCQLQTDVVANVRLTLARTLATHVLTKPYFATETTRLNCIYGLDLQEALKALKEDVDVDVRFCADGGVGVSSDFDGDLRGCSDDEGDHFLGSEYH